MFVFSCRINLLKELREEQQQLIEIARNEGEPCCYLRPGEVCDVCGRKLANEKN